MRRSKRVATLLAGTATLLILTACDEEPTEALLYSDLEACKVENTPEDCEKAFTAAKDWHAERTDRFKSQSECEDLFGQGRCEQVSAPASSVAGQSGQAVPGQTASSGSFFMPALMGFMLGRSMSGMGGMSAGYPVYSDRQGYVYAGGNRLGTCYPPENCPRPMGSATSSTRTGSSTSAFSSSSSRRYSVSSSGSSSSASSTSVSRGGFGATGSSTGSSGS